MSLQTATKMRKREREDETSATVTGHAAVRHSNCLLDKWTHTHTQQLAGDADDLSIPTISTTRVSRMFYWFINQSINLQYSLPSDTMNRNHIKTDKI